MPVELPLTLRLQAPGALLDIASIARAGTGFVWQLPLVRRKETLGSVSATLDASLCHAYEALAFFVRFIPLADREELV